MKKFFVNLKESFKHNWFLYLLGFGHLAFWLFQFIVMSEILCGNIEVSHIVDLNQVMFSHLGHEYTLYDMWFFMFLSAFMTIFVDSIIFVNKQIFNAISKRDYDRQIKSTK